jgi:hypothetical protein
VLVLAKTLGLLAGLTPNAQSPPPRWMTPPPSARSPADTSFVRRLQRMRLLPWVNGNLATDRGVTGIGGLELKF